MLILNSFSFVADLSFQLFALFSYSLFSSHVQRLCSRKTDSIGHFICIHKNSWKKWVQFSLFDGALFILRVHYSRERKAWQWILHVKRLNAPFPKNFNLLEWFSTVGFFEFFSTFSPTFICVIETYGSVTFFLCQEKCRNFRILSLWCCYFHEHFHVTGTHKWNNSTPSFSGNWLRNAMLYVLRVHACMRVFVSARIHHMVINFTLIRIYVRIFQLDMSNSFYGT